MDAECFLDLHLAHNKLVAQRFSILNSFSVFWSRLAGHSISQESKSILQPLIQKSWSWTILWRPTRPSRINTPKRCHFYHRGLECKSRKSRDIWSNRQNWPLSTKWSRTKANRICQENALLIANTLFQQHKRRLYTWTSPDGQYQNQIDYILCSQRWRSSIQSAKTRPGADWGSDHELFITNSNLNWRK